jgi:hypothetical protein
MARPNNAAAIQGHVQGLREAKAAFQALPEAVRDRMLWATELTVREIARHAKAYLESSPSIRTRALYNHVAWSINKKNGRGKAGVTSGTSSANARPGVRKNVKVKGIVIPGKGGSALTSEGAKLIRPTRYAHLIELGTKKFQAEPFMVPATESQKDPYLDRCRTAGKEVEKDLAAIGMRNL